MPNCSMALTLSHSSDVGAGLAVVEHLVRAVGVSGVERHAHVVYLEQCRPNEEYERLRERTAAMLDTISLKDNTRLVVEATGGAWAGGVEALWRPGVGAVRPRLRRIDDDAELHRWLARLHVEFQQGRVAFLEGLRGAEQVEQELLQIGAAAPLDRGARVGALALAVLVASRFRGLGEPRRLPDDPARDPKVRRLNLRPALPGAIILPAGA